jgi:AP endonuclease-2
MTDHGAFLLLNVYFPNYGGPERADFRNRFYTAFTDRCDELIRTGRSIVIATDFNTTYHPVDHCDFVKPFLEDIVGKSSVAEANRLVNETADWLVEQVKWVSDREFPSMQDVDDLLATNPPAHPTLPALLQTFFREKGSRLWAFMYLKAKNVRDCFRLHHADEPNRFTCWNTLIGARGGNYGTRIDYILAGGPLFASDPLAVVKDSNQMYDYMGSDHCPVWGDFDFPRSVDEGNKVTAPALAANIRRQQRLDSFFKSKSTSTKEKASTRAVMQTASSGVKIEKSCSISITARNTLFGVRSESAGVAELCDGHREPCKEWTVKKPGPNKGKRFYLCARPVGHPTDPQARCNFFKWKP